MQNKGVSGSAINWNTADLLSQVPRKQHGKSSSGGWATLEVKDPKRLEMLVGKYKPMRTRDFDSQITNLPGPKGITRRHHEEIAFKGIKQHGVKRRDNQAYISNIDDKFNAHKVDAQVFPSHKKMEKPLDPCTRRKDYDMKKFVLTETYDFLNPSKGQSRPC